MMVPSPVARRASRIAFGLVLIAGACAVAVATVLWESFDHHGHLIALVLAGLWPAAFAVAGAVWWLAGKISVPRGVDHLLRPSLVVPTLGIMLVLPLTIHLAVWPIFSGGFDGFDEWARLSVVVVGFTHVLLAVLAGVRASQLAAGTKPLSILAIYVSCVAVSLFPFIIPAAFVAVTGLPFIPLLRHQVTLAERERAEPALPMAVARSA